MKKIITFITTVCLLLALSISVYASDIQPKSSVNYGSFTVKSGETRYLYNNGANFLVRGGSTVTISYTSNPSGSIKTYFYNSSTGVSTRVYSTYKPSTACTGYFYIYNAGSSSVFVSNVKISF